jgi:hypothetical protein
VPRLASFFAVVAAGGGSWATSGGSSSTSPAADPMAAAGGRRRNEKMLLLMSNFHNDMKYIPFWNITGMITKSNQTQAMSPNIVNIYIHR